MVTEKVYLPPTPPSEPVCFQLSVMSLIMHDASVVTLLMATYAVPAVVSVRPMSIHAFVKGRR